MKWRLDNDDDVKHSVSPVVYGKSKMKKKKKKTIYMIVICRKVISVFPVFKVTHTNSIKYDGKICRFFFFSRNLI